MALTAEEKSAIRVKANRFVKTFKIGLVLSWLLVVLPLCELAYLYFR